MASAIKRWSAAKLAKQHGVDVEVAKKMGGALREAQKKGFGDADTRQHVNVTLGRKVHPWEESARDEIQSQVGLLHGVKDREARDKKGIRLGEKTLKPEPETSASKEKVQQSIDVINKAIQDATKEMHEALMTANLSHQRWLGRTDASDPSGQLTTVRNQDRDKEKAVQKSIKTKLMGLLDDIAVASDALEEGGHKVEAGTLRHKANLIKQSRWETLFAYK